MTGRAARSSAAVPYAGPMTVRPRFHANDSSRDVLAIERLVVEVANARDAATPPELEREGFQLFRHRSALADFRDPAVIEARHTGEIRDLLLEVSGADAVTVVPRGVLRFAERSPECGQLDNSHPARFVHVDVSDATAAVFAAQRESVPGPPSAALLPVQRLARPVAAAAGRAAGRLRCPDGRARGPGGRRCDLRLERAAPEWSFEALVVLGSARHRWSYFRDMQRDEVLVFKTNDSGPSRAHCVPHVAVDDPGCPPDVPPRMSIEMRGTAYWYDVTLHATTDNGEDLPCRNVQG